LMKRNVFKTIARNCSILLIFLYISASTHF
jgi:hypothetical protein